MERESTDDDCCHSSEQERDRRQEKKKTSSLREKREIEKRTSFDDRCASLSYLENRQDSK